MDNLRRKPTLAIIDDETNFAESLQLAVEDAYTVLRADSLRRARDLFREEVPDAILLDVRLPDGEGIELLRELKTSGRMPIVIVMTAYATMETAIRALKEGAVDYFTKPLDIDKLKRELNVYFENRSLQRKIVSLDREMKNIVPPFVTLGKGAMQAIMERVRAVAPLSIPVLLLGETGTGKERLAQWVHQLSGVSGELVAVSCAAVPKDIFESELFGYVKGAFSGAAANKEGLTEKADGGTLFLDELGELSDGTQAKLLRIIETGSYFKLGDPRERKARFRLITATNKDLGGQDSSFRRDLFYRINGITLELPRLRERKEDIPALAAAFLKEADHAYNKTVSGITEQAMSSLTEHDWPGNVRELKWCIHRAVATTSRTVLDAKDLEFGGSKEFAGRSLAPDIPSSLKDAVEALERDLIQRALKAADGNRTEAARILDISVRQLHYKIKQYSL